MATPGARIVGVDVARCLALLGMMATHVLRETDPDGTISAAQWLAGGRASALFAVLAGVGLALLTGGRAPVAGRERRARSVGIAARALLIAFLGLMLGDLGSGLAIILTYYGVLFLLGVPFLGLRARSLLGLAAVWTVVAPVLTWALRPYLPPRGTRSPHFAQLADPGQLLSELLFTGYYPAVPWLAYLLLGLALGRVDLRSRRVQVTMAVLGGLLAVLATQVSHLLTARPDVGAALLADAPEAGTVDSLLAEIQLGMFGSTPVGGSWEWLLVVAPHSSTPFSLAQGAGSAALALGLCLLVVGALRGVGLRFAEVLFGAGAMTLTLYSLHAVMRTPAVWPPETPDTYVWHVLVVLGIGAAYAGLRRRGPLEQVVSGVSGAVAWAARESGASVGPHRTAE